MVAEEHLAELQKLATARLKACNIAAKHQGLSLVDSTRLERLENLLLAVQGAFAADAARMTREYKDVIESVPSEHYNGKRFLIRHQDGEAIYRALSVLGFKDWPSGCLAGGK